uniref:Uncharacterized protein n=1 Tax=Anopheles atroparvus TaxID=41427 RepID=A0A182J198_ANOAO
MKLFFCGGYRSSTPLSATSGSPGALESCELKNAILPGICRPQVSYTARARPCRNSFAVITPTNTSVLCELLGVSDGCSPMMSRAAGRQIETKVDGQKVTFLQQSSSMFRLEEADENPGGQEAKKDTHHPPERLLLAGERAGAVVVAVVVVAVVVVVVGSPPIGRRRITRYESWNFMGYTWKRQVMMKVEFEGAASSAIRAQII